MAFQAHAGAPRQVTFNHGEPSGSTAQAALSQEALSRPSIETSQEWILFSPSQIGSSTDRTPTSQTIGLSRASELGSLNTTSRSGIPESEALEDGDDDVADAELDLLDDGLHAFQEPVYNTRSHQTQGADLAVLPVHDGLGSFQASAPPVLEQLWRHEQYNPKRKHEGGHRRTSSSIFGRLDALDNHDIQVNDEKRIRIEQWRLQQSQAMLEEVERETRRQLRRQSMRATGAFVSTEDILGSTPKQSTHLSSDQEDEHEPFWRRITRTFIRDVIGIDEPLLSVILGESLPEEALEQRKQALPTIPEQSVPQMSDDQSWRNRLLQRIARELGVFVHQLSPHPGAFSTYSTYNRQSQDYAGMPVSVPKPKEFIAPGDIEVSSSSLNPTFSPTVPNDKHAETWGLEDEHPSTNSASLNLKREREYWERELDVKMVFRYLRDRFVDSTPEAVPKDISMEDTAKRTAIIRQHHPLIARAQRSPARVRRESRMSTRRPASSCASESVKSSRKSLGKSGSSRNYWDIGGSIGSGDSASALICCRLLVGESSRDRDATATMADDGELAYLQPGFDLNSLTVPRLRNILVQHGIPFASSAKKAQIIEIIETDLLPKAKKLLRERDRVRRTSKGITNVGNEEDAPGPNDEDGELMPPPPPPVSKTPRSRKSKSNLGEDTPATSRRSRTPGARKSSSKARQSDTEVEGAPTPSTKKTRKSLPVSQPAVPAVRVEEPAKVKTEDGSSPFSDDNPFQSGSSPVSESRRISSSSRLRQSTGRPSSGRRRAQKSPQVKQEDDDGFDARAYNHIQADEDGVMTTEEFTPDAKKELEMEQANGVFVPSRPAQLVRRKKKPASTAAKLSPFAFLAFVSVALGSWYRQEKVKVGYCGVGQPQWSLAENEHVPAWVHDHLQPTCEPCPSHAICYPNLDVRCENDFILKPHPLSLYGLVPLPPTCEPDSEKEKRIKAVADKAIEKLRQRRAAYECGEELEGGESSVTAQGPEAKPEIHEERLKQQVSKLRRKDMGQDEFEDLWQSALGDITNRDETEITKDDINLPTGTGKHSSQVPLSPNLESYAPSDEESGDSWPRIKLAEKVFDRLATQAAMKETGRVSEAFLSVRGLRDDILRHVFKTREREVVWEHVKNIVEGNSNVRASDRESERTGEVSRVWEWMGPTDLASAFSGRLSAGSLLQDNSPQAKQIDGIAVRRWDEGTPSY
ncbi:hypothetical protein DV738_g1155, partial [Chaetothyriales sp. CBS 135597]